MSKIDNFSQEEIKEIFVTSKSFKEVAQKFGYSGCNGNLIKKLRELSSKINFESIPNYLLKEQRKKKEDYIGKFFGELEVVDIDKERSEETGITYFLCKCHHCNKKELHSVSISTIAKTKTCGCLKNERFIPGRYEDLTGQIFGHFKVLDLNKEDTIKYDKTYWNCQCTLCNKNIVSVWAWDLKSNHRDNCGCYNRKSKGEEKITHILTSNNIIFKREFSFENFYNYKGHPYRFDFAIFDDKNNLQFLIEYQGKQHYIQTGWEDLSIVQERDTIKKEYCLSHNIPLIIIPYTDFEIIDTTYLLNKIKEVT